MAGPPSPPRLGAILAPATRPNPALQRAEFFRIFGACGAAPRGGGGAPPTTLILLRNQVNARVAAARPRETAVGGVSGASRTAFPPKIQKIFFFLKVGCCLAGRAVWGAAIGCADVAVGGGRGRRLPQCLSSPRVGVEPYRARSPRLGRSPALACVTTYGGPRATLRGVGPRLARANGLPLSASATSPARDCRPLP